jgi:hypothetical protein
VILLHQVSKIKNVLSRPTAKHSTSQVVLTSEVELVRAPGSNVGVPVVSRTFRPRCSAFISVFAYLTMGEKRQAYKEGRMALILESSLRLCAWCRLQLL